MSNIENKEFSNQIQIKETRIPMIGRMLAWDG